MPSAPAAARSPGRLRSSPGSSVQVPGVRPVMLPDRPDLAAANRAPDRCRKRACRYGPPIEGELRRAPAKQNGQLRTPTTAERPWSLATHSGGYRVSRVSRIVAVCYGTPALGATLGASDGDWPLAVSSRARAVTSAGRVRPRDRGSRPGPLGRLRGIAVAGSCRIGAQHRRGRDGRPRPGDARAVRSRLGLRLRCQLVTHHDGPSPKDRRG